MKKFVFINLLLVITVMQCLAQDPDVLFNKDHADPDLLQELIFQKVNDFRSKKKLAGLAHDKSLWEAANMHAVYLQKKGELSHFQNKKKYKTPFDRVKSVTNLFNSVGENVAYVSVATILMQGKEEKREYKTYEQIANELVDNWLKSKPHLANIKDKSYTHSGIAVLYDADTGRMYAVHVFGGK